MIRLERDGPVAVIVFDRPAQRNALTPEMLVRLVELADQAKGHSAAVVLAGNGKAFCAGFDLDLCRAHPDGSVMRALLTGLSAAIQALRGLAIPVVAAAHGGAIAGGCALLGGADVVVADRGARLGYPVVRLGVSPAVSAPFLTRSVGYGLARARLLDPRLIDGSEAARMGLVHRLVELPGDVRPESVRIASELATRPSVAMATTKGWLNSLAPTDASEGLAASLRLAGGAEERERLAATKQTPPAR